MKAPECGACVSGLTERKTEHPMKLGRILGFQISLDLSWFIIFAMVVLSLLAGGFPHRLGVEAPPPGLELAVLGALLLFGSVLAHELGHSVVGRKMGVEIEGITLFIFGGIARLKDEPRKPAVEFWMTLAGPAVSAFLAVAFYAAGRVGMALGWAPGIVAMLGYLSLTNQALFLFNMAPAFPLDGGRILRSVLWWVKKDVLVATGWSAAVSRVLAFTLIFVGAVSIVRGNMFGMWEVFIGLFVLSAASSAYNQVAMRRRLESISVSSLLAPGEQAIPARMPLNLVMETYFVQGGPTAYPVEDQGEVRGVLSKADVLEVPDIQRPWTVALEISKPLAGEDAIEDGADAWQALTKMLAANAGQLLVLRDGRILGVLTRDSVLRHLDMRGPV